MLVGKAGIAKTTAIILFCHLSTIATDYQYAYGLDEIPKTPKIFYLSYSSEIESFEDLLDQILSQCPPSLAEKIGGKF